jgi:hypothetical protein
VETGDQTGISSSKWEHWSSFRSLEFDDHHKDFRTKIGMQWNAMMMSDNVACAQRILVNYDV